MKLILPVTGDIQQNIRVPATLLDSEEGKITLEEFSLALKEWFFGIPGLSIGENGTITSRGSVDFLHYRLEFLPYVKGKCIFIVEKHTNNPWDLTGIQHKLDFASRIILGCGFPISKLTGTTPPLGESLMYSGTPIISRRLPAVLNDESFEELRSLFSRLEDPRAGKFELLRALLNAAMTQVAISKSSFDIQGALFVTLIESLLVPDKAPEVSYRFSLRYAKLTNSGLEGMKKASVFYRKRSNTFHTGSGNFSVEEISELEAQACSFIEEYFLDPERFSEERMNSLLLGTL